MTIEEIVAVSAQIQRRLELRELAEQLQDALAYSERWRTTNWPHSLPLPRVTKALELAKEVLGG
jgi:hypothetical protein